MAPPARPSQWEALPAEIRVLIYEHALRFKHPIKKRPCRKGTSAPVQVVVGSRFALLVVNKQTLHEGLPVLYDCNTISITHMGLHSLLSPARQLDLEHITHLKIRRDPRHYDSWESCMHCQLPQNLYRQLATSSLPKLQSVTIAVTADWMAQESSWRHVRNGLVQSGKGMEFTGVGRCRMTSPADRFEVAFEHCALTEAWDYLTSLSPAEVDQGCAEPDTRYAAERGISFAGWLNMLAIVRHHHMATSEVWPATGQVVVSLAWLDPKNQNAEVFMRLTSALESLIRMR